MSREIRYKNITAETIRAHCDSVIAQATESVEFGEVCRRADGMGIDISVSVRNTYTTDKAAEYTLPSVYDDIPYGYAADICFDLVRDGRVLFCITEQGEPEQMSLSYTAVVTASTVFFHKLKLLEYDEIIGIEHLPAVLGEFLDMAETRECKTSVIMENSAYPEEADRPLHMMTERAELPQCKCVEISAGSFDGTSDRTDSVFFTESAFMPYMYLLECERFGFFSDHGISVIDRELWDKFCADAAGLCRAIKHEVDFTAALCSLMLYSIEPVPRAEFLLEEVTFWRKKEFTEQTDRFIEWGSRAMAEHEELTVYWD